MIKAYPVSGKQKSVDICQAFIDGAPKSATGAVFYGVNETNHHEWRAAKKAGDWYYIDNSFFDKVRGQQYRVAKNRVQLQPSAFDRNTSRGERFDALGIDVMPMNARPSNRWIVVEQSPSFMKFVAEEVNWLDDYISRLPANAKVLRRRWAPNKLKQQETLPADLADAWTLVTHSSAAAVTALLLGVPCITSPMSAIHRCRWSTDPEHDERRSYFNVLAENQFSLTEFRNGDAWRCLNP